MEELFRMSGDNKNSAFFFLLVEIYTQNCIQSELLAKLYAESSGKDFNEVANKCQTDFQDRKKKILSEIQLLFGDINLNDILKPDKPS